MLDLKPSYGCSVEVETDSKFSWTPFADYWSWLNRLNDGSTNLWAPCSRSASGTRSSGWGLGWNARPPPCWCHPGSRWTGRSGSSGTRRPAAAPCPPLWWPAAPRGRVGCWAPGGFPFWSRKPASGVKTDMHHVCSCLFWCNLLPVIIANLKKNPWPLTCKPLRGLFQDLMTRVMFSLNSTSNTDTETLKWFVSWCF